MANRRATFSGSGKPLEALVTRTHQLSPYDPELHTNTHNQLQSHCFHAVIFFRFSSTIGINHAAALLYTPVKSREVGITHRRCGKRVAHCWHSSCSPWRMPPPLPLPSYSSFSISSNICCTCRDAALSNSWGTEKQQETARSSIYSSVPSALWLQSFILLKSKILHTQ